MQILIVEDNPGDVRLIRECFRDTPYPQSFTVVHCERLAQAIQYLNSPDKEKIDVILLDLGLSDSLGLETLQKVQIHTSGIPIIVLTGMDDSDLALQAVKEGAQDYLIKSQISGSGHLLVKSILYAVERKNVETLKYESKITEEANRKKSEFLAMMSHELRNPLGIILGFSDLMVNSEDGNEQRKFAKTIQSNANHLNELINDLLDLSRVEAGRIDLDKMLFNLSQEMEIICEGLRIQAAIKGLELTVTFDDRVPQFVSTDRTRLRQIIYNLVGNAMKFTSSGSINVHVHKDPQEQSLNFLVKDSGCGVDKKDRPNLFEPFSQANKTVHRQYKGTGLGLALSKQLARRMGGDLILLESHPGKGSTFLLSIDAGLEQESSAVEEKRKSAGVPSHPLQGVRVIVVDDDSAMRDLQVDILVAAGAEVRAFESGKQAIEEFEAWSPDIFFMDLHMPDLNGFDNVRTLKDQGIVCPIIAVTGSGTAEEKKNCLVAGYDDFLTKPFKIDSYIEMAAKWSDESIRRQGNLAPKPHSLYKPRFHSH